MLGALLIWPCTAFCRPPILLQSSAGPSAKQIQRYVEQMVSALGKEELLHGDELIQAIERNHSSSTRKYSSELVKGVRDKDSRKDSPNQKIRVMVEDGRRLFIEGEFEAAITQLESARSMLFDSAVLMVSDQGLRDTLHKALLYLAHAYLRTKQTQRADERIAEVLRSFPGRDISLARYGPELLNYAKEVRNKLEKKKKGSLAISVHPKGCLVFINERFVGLGPTKVVNLYPGEYRIYIQRPQQQGRVHKVVIVGDQKHVFIDFELDLALHTAPFVGLLYSDWRTLKRLEKKHATALAKALDSPAAVVIGVRRVQGRRVLQGTVVSTATKKIIRSGLVTLEPTEPRIRTIKALGQFLVSGTEGQGVIVQRHHDSKESSREHDLMLHNAKHPSGQRFFSSRIFKWVFAGVATVSLCSGIVLLAIDGDGTCDAPSGVLCPERYKTNVPGTALTITGGLALGAAGILFHLDRSTSTVESTDDLAENSLANRCIDSIAVVPWLVKQTGGIAAFFTF